MTAALKRLAICIVGIELLGFLSAVIGGSGNTVWYQVLQKPWFSPPPWIFGVVWPILYAMMAISLALVWGTAYHGLLKIRAYKLFFLQLGINLLHPVVFFRFESTLGGFLVVVALTPALIATWLTFRGIRRAAAWLLVPYLLWTLFALVLSFEIWRLNLPD